MSHTYTYVVYISRSAEHFSFFLLTLLYLLTYVDIKDNQSMMDIEATLTDGRHTQTFIIAGEMPCLVTY